MGTAPSKTTHAMVDSWTMLSNTLRPPHSCSRLTTHTLEPTLSSPSASTTLLTELVRLLDSLMSKLTQLVPTLRLPSPADQSQLPSRPTRLSSNLTQAVSSPPLLA